MHKAGIREIVDLLINGKAQLVDIRFKEEFAAWQVGPSNNIPLNELPKRLSELDKNKIIVTACPHKDRAIIAMIFLKTKGYKTMYLKDGLIGLAEYLRGDNAHHIAETVFKAFGRAVRVALEADERMAGKTPSTKGKL